MKRIILATLALMLIPSLLWAAPFLVCNPYLSTAIQPDGFEVVMDGLGAYYSPAVEVAEGKILKDDVSNVSSGSHTVSIRACINDSVWGRLCSDAAVFTFARPSAAAPPVNIMLSK